MQCNSIAKDSTLPRPRSEEASGDQGKTWAGRGAGESVPQPIGAPAPHESFLPALDSLYTPRLPKATSHRHPQCSECLPPMNKPARLLFPAGNENQSMVPAQNREASRQLGMWPAANSQVRSRRTEMSKRQRQVG